MTALTEGYDALAVRLKTLGLSVHDDGVGQIVPPAAIMEAPTVDDYRDDLGEGSVTADIEVLVLVTAATDLNQRALLPYMDRTGPQSLFALVKQDPTLGVGGDVFCYLLSSRPLNRVQIAQYQSYGRSFIFRLTVGG